MGVIHAEMDPGNEEGRQRGASHEQRGKERNGVSFFKKDRGGMLMQSGKVRTKHQGEVKGHNDGDNNHAPSRGNQGGNDAFYGRGEIRLGREGAELICGFHFVFVEFKIVRSVFENGYELECFSA